MCGGEILYLPCLDSGQNLNLTSDDMADLRFQGIDVDNNYYHVPKNIPYEVPQPEDGYSWISEGIIFPRQSKNSHNTYVALKNYSCEEVIKMTKLGIFNFFPVDNLK